MTTLQTERLTLSPYVETDFDAMAQLHGTQTVMAHMRDGAVGRDEARRYFDSYLENWKTNGISVWALFKTDDNTYVGECGFWLREGFAGYALRYILAEPYWRQGFGGEAARAALQWGFGNQQIPEVNAVSHLENPGSARILQGLGFQLVDTSHKNLDDMHRYRITREDWFKRENGS